jgi:reverse gyrase
MKNSLKVYYQHICPIKQAEIELADEIFTNQVCAHHYHQLGQSFQQSLLKLSCNKAGDSKSYCQLSQKLEAYTQFFQKNFGFPPSNLNRYWAKKILKGESFSIIAPTGIGKTTFGIAIAHFLKGKVYYLVPSKILLEEISEKLLEIKSDKKVLVARSQNDLEEINRNDFDILLTTATFLHRYIDQIPKNFDLVFIDDADSLIRQPRNIDKVLKLIKVTEEEIEKALTIIDKKRQARQREDFRQIGRVEIDKQSKGSVIAASATLTPRTKRIALFRELLNFEIGSSTTFLRNIKETYKFVPSEKLQAVSADWIKKLGQGGFIFLSDDFSRDDLKHYLKYLTDYGIKAISYEKFTPKNRRLFINREIDVVVGFSNIRNPLTRGIDIPHRIRYALFVGVPKFKIPLKLSFSPLSLFLLSLSFLEIVNNDQDKSELERGLRYLRKISFLKEEQVLANEIVKSKIEPIKALLEKIIAQPDFVDKINHHPEYSIIWTETDKFLLVSDPRGYLQASGRTSRLFPLGLTQGFSLILVENQNVFTHLQQKLTLLGYRPDFIPVDKLELKQVFQKIDRDRRLVEKIMTGKEVITKDPIETALVIVESPTKAKTIANFFGRPAKRLKGDMWVYEVSLGNLNLNIVATLGHFVDLAHTGKYYGVVKKNNWFIPIFQPIRTCAYCGRGLDTADTRCYICGSTEITTKAGLIEQLKQLAFEVQRIIITTDPDTEGEKIAYDLSAYLYPYNQRIERIELHEITRDEFIRQLKSPRPINQALVAAQIIRRISDRWIGFRLSKKIQQQFENLNLSAGRVQSPVLGWIIKKKERMKDKQYLLQVTAGDLTEYFLTDNKKIVTEIKEQYKAGELKLKISIGTIKEKITNPPPPYQTSDLLKDAVMFLRLDAQTTMKLAQNLFEQGYITYHRTDSNFISETGRSVARNYLDKKHLLNMWFSRAYGQPGTHEGIRPTKPLDVQDIIEQSLLNGQIILSRNHLKLYGLIFNRFISSQSKPGKTQIAKVTFSLGDLKKQERRHLKIIEEGHLKFFRNIRLMPATSGIFPITKLKVSRISKEYPYTQATIIDEMKRKGLGRPSTYAQIVNTIAERKYIIANKGYLFPTKLGEEIYNWLNKIQPDLIAEDFTKKLEEQMDKVETGRANYQTILKQLFNKIFISKKNVSAAKK